jgi:hypothetical protein
VRVLGVDPGGSGALALLLEGGVLIADMPVFLVKRGKSAKAELDTHTLIATLKNWDPNVCYFEQVGGIPGQSASAAFNFGRIAGACEAIVKASGARFVFVTPAVWKKAMQVSGSKDEARAKATNLFPAQAAEFRRKKDDGRAEAALLAEYGRRLEATTIFS